MKIIPREKGETRWGEPRLAWDDFHARSRFARSTIPEEKWRLLVVYISDIFRKFDSSIHTSTAKRRSQKSPLYRAFLVTVFIRYTWASPLITPPLGPLVKVDSTCEPQIKPEKNISDPSVWTRRKFTAFWPLSLPSPSLIKSGIFPQWITCSYNVWYFTCIYSNTVLTSTITFGPTPLNISSHDADN